jgi:hypothetical protein
MKTHLAYLFIIAVVAIFFATRPAPEPDKPSPDLANQLAALTRENQELKTKVKAVETKPEPGEASAWDALESFSEGEAAANEDAEAKEDKKANAFAAWKDMARNPEFKQMMKDQQRLKAEEAVAIEYRMLVDWFDLEGDDRETFKALLLKREMASNRMGWKMMAGDDEDGDGKFNSASMRAMMTKTRLAQEEVEKEIEAFLTPEAYDEYAQYQETREARSQVDKMQPVFSNASMPLSEEQRGDLVEVIHEIRRGSPDQVEQKLEHFEALEQDPEQWKSMMQQHLDTQDLQAEQVVENAAGFLDEGQLVELRNHLDRELKQQEIGIRMAEQWAPMWMEQNKADPPAENTPAPEAKP